MIYSDIFIHGYITVKINQFKNHPNPNYVGCGLRRQWGLPYRSVRAGCRSTQHPTTMCRGIEYLG